MDFTLNHKTVTFFWYFKESANDFPRPVLRSYIIKKKNVYLLWRERGRGESASEERAEREGHRI